MEKNILIIGGAGRIGLALATVLSKVYKVSIFDTDRIRVSMLKKGEIPFYEPNIDLHNIHFEHTLPIAINNSTHILIAIGTPIDEYLNPTFGPIHSLFETICPIITDQKIGICSTLYPGTTKNLSKKFNLDIVYIPERIATGQMINEMYEIPQIIASKNLNLRSEFGNIFTQAEISIYFLDNTLDGELAKLFTNAYRYIHFSISNQFQIICHNLNTNYKTIFDAMKFKYPRLEYLPKPGFTGGYCLRKDTLQLAAIDNTFQLGYAATQINEYIPLMIFRHIRKHYKMGLKNMTIGLLGMAFKGDTDDIRDSLTFRMKKILINEVNKVLITDPYYKGQHNSKMSSLNYVLENSDLIIICTYHSDYDQIKFGTLKFPVIDIMQKYPNCIHL